MLTNQNRILIYSFIEILITVGWKDNPDTCGGFKFSSQYPRSVALLWTQGAPALTRAHYQRKTYI